MASITINPTSNSFRSNGGSGTIGVTVETANWSSTPSDDAVWMAVRERTNLTWSAWSIIKIKGEDGADGQDGEDGSPGADGRGIRSTNIYYATSGRGDQIPSSGWVQRQEGQAPPQPNPGQYLWTKIEYVYTSGSNTYAYSVSRYGENGDVGSHPTMVYAGYFNKDPNTSESKTMTYQGNNNVVSVVYHKTSEGGQYWVAKPEASTTYGSVDGTFRDSSSSPNSTYWTTFGASFDSVATGVVFAEKGYIENLLVKEFVTRNVDSDGHGYLRAERNSLAMFDGSNNQRLLITGDDLSAIGSNQGSYVTTPSRTFSASSGYLNESQTFWSGLSISNPSNVLSLPQMTVQVNKSSGNASELLTARGEWFVDGNVVSVGTYNNNVSASTTQVSFAIPATNVNLSKGTHFIGVRLYAETPTSSRLSSVTIPAVVISLDYTSRSVEIGANGFRVAFSSTQYAEFTISGSTAKFEIRNSNYGVRLSPTYGLQKSSNMDESTPDWTTL